MATSGSTDWSLTSRQIITRALENVGAIAMRDTPPAEDAALALSVLNEMVKTWGAQGHLWTLTEGSVTPVASTASYTTTPVSLARQIISVRRRLTSSTRDTPMGPLSRRDYFNIPTKASTGTPVCWYFDRQRTSKALYVWPAPDATFAAANTLQITYQRVIEDLDALDNDHDFPQEWTEALIYGLSARLLIPYSVHVTDPAKAAKIEERATVLLDQLSTDDLEGASVFILPGQ